MLKYIIKRILLGLVVLFGVICLTFLITRVLPTDPALKWAGPKATTEQVQAARVELGLDLPIHIQFVNYLNDLLHGNLGTSYTTRRPISQELQEAIPATLELVFYSVIIGVFLGIFFGIYSAKHKNRLIDHIVRFFSISAVSMPSFALALILQLVFYSYLKIFPLGGRISTDLTLIYNLPKLTGWYTIDSLLTGNWILFKDAVIHLILPSIPIAIYPLGTVARITRSSLLEVLGEDYITSARSYGIKESFVLWHYALKNTIGTTATVTALTIGYTLVNTFLIEAIFNWPGIGKYVADSVLSMNYPGIMGVTLFSTVSYLILNLVADLIIAVDPRVRI